MKKNKWYYLFFLLFTSQSLLAQDSLLVKAYEIKTDTLLSQQLDSATFQILEDKGGKWSIREVSAFPVAGQFNFPQLQKGNAITAVHTYWFRYQLKNIMSYPAHIALNSESDYDDFYLFWPGGKQEHFLCGTYRNRKEKNAYKRSDFVPLILQPGQQITVYQRIQNNKPGIPKDFTIRLLGTEKATKKYYVDVVDETDRYFGFLHLQEAFVIGLLLITALFNIFFFKVVKEKLYLYFALFIFFLAINRTFNIFSEYANWEAPHLKPYVVYIGHAWFFINLFMILFFRQAFKTFKEFPKWDKFLLTILGIHVIMNLVFFSLNIFHHPAARFFSLAKYLVFLLIPILLLITSLFYIRKKENNYRLLITAAFPLLVFWGFIGSLIETYAGVWRDRRPGVIIWIGNHYRTIEILCLSWFVLFFSWLLFMRFDKLRKENAQQALDKERLAKEKEIERNELIAAQKVQLEKDVAARTIELKQSIEDLKATQSQLIQSEKMASLGELTAGIAHEIQNPLNFVNNFSEVSNELIDELQEERNKPAAIRDESLENDLLTDIKQNLEKINHHGKRADAIVKGMLQHSRSSSGQKEPTDINKLADEYLRLAYHGLRAKDKSFNATLKTDYDASIGNINIISQDMGRVILNLITNAFYAVDEKRRQAKDNRPQQPGNSNDTVVGGPSSVVSYEPTVSISTKKVGNKVEITVKDNGNGIPQKVLDKIFQPFFTTKPTGQGTGLGLSLSYDIIKAHGGELNVETKEGEFAAFVITLPV